MQDGETFLKKDWKMLLKVSVTGGNVFEERCFWNNCLTKKVIA